MKKLKREKETVTVDPKTFLLALSSPSSTALCRPDQHLIVKGNVDLRKHPQKSKITELPESSISGDLLVDETCALRVCRSRIAGSVKIDGSLIEEFLPAPDLAGSVTGKMSAKNCARLRRIAGVFNNDVTLDGSGIQELGPDFQCKGNLSLEGCNQLRLLDCSAWSAIADNSTLEKTGPNAAIENFSAERCLRLAEASPIARLRWAKFDGSGVTKVHPKFTCAGPVSFRRCRKLASLNGAAQTVEVSMAPLERIGNLTADEAIFTDCKGMPTNMSGLRVKALVFARCGLKEIPAGIQPSTPIRIGDCSEFSRLPSHWKNDISLTGLPSLKSTPPGFRCLGKFDVENCVNLAEISGVIDGGLYLMAGLPKLRTLGSSLEVRGDLWISPQAGVSVLGCKVFGSLTARAGTIRETLPSLAVGGHGDFQASQSLEYLRGNFGGSVVLDESSIVSLGADLEVSGDISLKKTKRLTTLNCSSSGYVLVVDSSLQNTGPAFRCGKGLNIRNCPRFDTVQGVVGGRARVSRTIKKLEKPSPAAPPGPRSHPRPCAKMAMPDRVYRTEAFAPGHLP